MDLATLFPRSDLIRTPTPEMPDEWQKLLSMDKAKAFGKLADIIGFPHQSSARQTVMGARDIGVLTPKRKRAKKQVTAWSLAVQYSSRLALLFGAPSPEF